MKVIENITVPTGNILIGEGSKGKLEFLSLGDYGKEVNIKCDALGLSREPSPIRHTELLPLKEKWVITISTQYGCSMNCTFCDVPQVGSGKNASFNDLRGQVLEALRLHPEVETSDRLNVHFARMGEPTWNPDVLDCAKWLKEHIDPEFSVHPVVSTMMPRNNKWLKTFIHSWMRIKNRLYKGNAGLQLSINSTSEAERFRMFDGNALELHEIAEIMRDVYPTGRKVTLNFAIGGYEINPRELLKWFSPDLYIIKLTPMHKTHIAVANDIKTEGDYTAYYPYKQHEEELRKAGYEVLVFIASVEEDMGRITCGNAILSGSKPSFMMEG